MMTRLAQAPDLGIWIDVQALENEARTDPGRAVDLVSEKLVAVPQDRRSGVADLFHASIGLGLLTGFLDAATVHARTRTRPWPGSGYERAADDPHLILRFGRFVAALEALRALVEEAAAAVQGAAPDAGRKAALARQHAINTGASFVSGTIELLGASATSVRHGFDQRWRDILSHARSHPTVGRLQAD
jgi:alkylation response protein AidB-like acyl-CoA dehydrogenase